jgi:hypothetical protein
MCKYAFVASSMALGYLVSFGVGNELASIDISAVCFHSAVDEFLLGIY